MAKSSTKQELIADVDLQRLDIFLSGLFSSPTTISGELPKVSRSQWKKAILAGRVTVNGEIVTQPQLKLHLQDKVAFDLEGIVAGDGEQTVIVPEEMQLPIIYEDSNMLVVNKPVGLVVHPAAGHTSGTLANGIKHYLQAKGEDEFPAHKVGLVHRLDAPTSGVLLVAKNLAALGFLSGQFADRKVKKHYLALVKGDFQSELVVSDPIGRDRNHRQKFSSRAHNSSLRDARTEFRLLYHSDKTTYSLVMASPYTGRTHQIRVHLAESGYPIVGDATYRGEGASRLMLHSMALQICKPGESEPTSFAVLPGTDFKEVLAAKAIPTAILKHALNQTTQKQAVI